MTTHITSNSGTVSRGGPILFHDNAAAGDDLASWRDLSVSQGQRSEVASNKTRLVLTRRGRIAVLVVALTILIGLAMTLGSSTSASGDNGETLETTSVAVQQDQTLWQIAAEANPQGDIGHTVDQIMKLNSLPNASSLQMGEEIAVPVYQ